MTGFTLRGPGKLGATVFDEGGASGLTAAVVARFAQVPEDVAKRDGPVLAAAVLPARRALWRLAEQVLPRELAAALRARCDPSDQTGRGGVRELREALADWLDPPRRCRHCARAIRPGTEGLACKSFPPRAHPQRRAQTVHGPVCKARTGRPHLGRAVGVRDFRGRIMDSATLPLFTPVQVDPGCAAAAKMLKHGGPSAYDLVVDRDLRVLLASLQTPAAADTPAVARARRNFDRAMDRALRANGRLVLGVQSRYFTPHGSVTRADLLQGGADGLRRALLDYDPAVAKISTYAINWIYQGMGAVFAGRDAVDVPDWARRLRVDVEEMGVDPGLLLGALDVLTEAWGLVEDPSREATPPPAALRPWGLVAGCYELAGVLLPGALLAHQRAAKRATSAAAVNTDTTPAAVPARAPDIHVLAAGLARAAVTGGKANPSAAKGRPSERAERVRERLALACGDALGLGCKGPAMLTALRHGASQVVVAAGEGERDDAGGGDDGAPGAGGGRKDRSPEHLRSLGQDGADSEDAEQAAAEAQEAAQKYAALGAALEAVRLADPEAAEVVRRRHGLDGGDPETYEGIAESGLRCSGRVTCRETIRKLYVSATRRMEAAVRAGPSHAIIDATGMVAAETVSTAESRLPLETPVVTAAVERALRTFAMRRAAIRPEMSASAAAQTAPSSPVRRRRQAGVTRSAAVAERPSVAH